MIWTAPQSAPPLVSLGQRFERLVVIGDVDRSQARPRVLCRCDCGTRKFVGINALKTGGTKSCGCLATEKRRAATAKNIAQMRNRHG